VRVRYTLSFRRGLLLVGSDKLQTKRFLLAKHCCGSLGSDGGSGGGGGGGRGGGQEKRDQKGKEYEIKLYHCLLRDTLVVVVVTK
jgi:hypothetical protein